MKVGRDKRGSPTKLSFDLLHRHALTCMCLHISHIPGDDDDEEIKFFKVGESLRKTTWHQLLACPYTDVHAYMHKDWGVYWNVVNYAYCMVSLPFSGQAFTCLEETSPDSLTSPRSVVSDVRSSPTQQCSHSQQAQIVFLEFAGNVLTVLFDLL